MEYIMYRSKGKTMVRMGDDGLEFTQQTREDAVNAVNEWYTNDEGYNEDFRTKFISNIFDIGGQYVIIDGNEFCEGVSSNKFTDQKGKLIAVIIDGYITNIGIFDNALHQGAFSVSLSVFKKMCSGSKDVKVIWHPLATCDDV